jgi:hypothetical protein
MVKAQSSVRRVASVPMPVPRRWPRKMPNSARRKLWSMSSRPHAGQLPVGGVEDGEPHGARARGRAGLAQLLVPLRLAVLVDHAAVGQAAPHFGIVEPDRQPRKVVAAQQPEGRALA